MSGSCYYSNANAVLPVTLVGPASARSYYYTASWTLTTAQAECAAAPAGVWQ